MNNYNYKQTETELDIKACLWGIITQWKAVILASLIMAALVCGAKYVKEIQSYKSQMAEQREIAEQIPLSADEKVTKALEQLPEDERSAVEHIIKEQEWIDEQRDYLQKSVLMNTDTSNQRALYMLFDINCESSDKTATLKQAYKLCQYDQNLTKDLKKVIAPDADEYFIQELLSVECSDDITNNIEETGGPFAVRLILPEDADASAAEEKIKKEIEKYTSEHQLIGQHTVSFVGAEVIYFYNRDAVSNKQSLINNINALETNIKNTQNALSDSQKEALTAITTIRKEAALIDDAAEQIANTEESANTEEIKAPEWSIKYALLGFILGVLFYSFIYITMLIIRGRIGSAANAENNTGVRLIGEIYYDNEPVGIAKILHSKFIENRHYRGKADKNVQIEKSANAISALCEHSGIKNVTLLDATGIPASDKATEIIDSLLSSVGKKGIDTSTVDVSEEIVDMDLLGIEYAVLVINDNTKIPAVNRLIAMCDDYGIKVFGSVYVSEK